ncbi:MAG: hypothetical protein B6241_12865 [Spirochaetaceae bacterium 4572_59]|nr:MAG: hypothetical protein B6241_12865 [Spirochaetaceae bacterium 4572_59]
MNKTFIALLYGGRSGEHEVSLRSAASVLKHLKKDLYHIYLIGISKSGIWFRQEFPGEIGETLIIKEDPTQAVSVLPGQGLYCLEEKIPAEVVFPVLHGTFGEDGTIQGLLEIADLPYLGATVGGSYLGMDKDVAKIIWEHHNLPVVPFKTLRKQETEHPDFSWDTLRQEMVQSFGLPIFVKPSQSGSSVGVSRVDREEQFQSAAEEALRFDNKILIEPGVDAREVECSVIGNTDPLSFPPGELSPSHDFYDYEAKYIDPDGAALIIPAKLSAEKAKNVRDIAEKAYKALECRGMARVDFFLDKSNENVYLNEINTIPGFTSISMFALMCEAGGLCYSDLLDKLVFYAFEEYENHRELCFSLN